MLVGFEHIGMTVSDMDRSIEFYCGLLGLTLRLRRKSPGAEVAFLDAAGGQLEMVCLAGEPARRAREVPQGEAGMRHMTFAVDDVEETWSRLERAGVQLQQKPRPAHNSDVFSKVAFVYDPDGIIVELVQRADGAP